MTERASMAMSWRADVVAAVGRWAATQHGSATGTPWRDLGVATAYDEHWLVLDLRNARSSPESVNNVCLSGAGGPDRDQAFPVAELRVVDGVVHLRAPVGLPRQSLHVWTQAISTRFLVEKLRQGLQSLKDAPLADALALGEISVPPSERVTQPGLLPAQVDALSACLSPGVRLVWGPPGTGKTEVLARAIVELVRRGRRILVVSTANIAVDNALLAASRRLQAHPGAVIRVGPAQLREVATDSALQLDLLAGRASADADRQREEVGAALLQLHEHDAEHERLRVDLTDYDDVTFRAAAAKVDAEEATVELGSRVRAAEQVAEAVAQTWDQAAAALRDAQCAFDAAAVPRTAYAEFDRLVADLVEVEKDRAAAMQKRDDVPLPSANGLFAARRARRHREETAEADAAVKKAEDRRSWLLSLRAGAMGRTEAASRADLALLDTRLDEARARSHAAEGRLQEARRDLVVARNGLAAAERVGGPTRAEKEMVHSCRSEEKPARYARLRTLASQRDARLAQRVTLEEEHRKLVDRSRRLRIDAEQELVHEARVVATTLARSRLHPAVSREVFDAVFVDEAGAATMAEVLLALSRGRTTAVLFGDFLQLGPVLDPSIEKDSDPAVGRWIQRTCFGHLGITRPREAMDHPGCVALLDQFRFGPALRSLANAVNYEVLRDAGVGPGRQTDIILVDVSTVPDLADIRQGTESGRRWAIGVVLSRALAELHLPEGEVGIVTPYRKQAEATLEGCRDRGLVAGISVGTAHAFQGREFDTVIFDLVDDGRGWVAAGHRDRGSYEDKGLRLFGVGVTRARHRLYVIVDGRGVTAAAQGPLAGLRDGLVSGDVRRWSAAALLGLDEPATDVTDSMFDDVASLLRQLVTVTDVNDEHSFVAELEHHVRAAREQLWMWSPWLAIRARTVIPLVHDAVRRGVDVRILVRPDHDKIMRQPYAQTQLADLHATGAVVIRSDVEHRKIVIVDRDVVLLGSLNPLSARPGATREVMLTMQGRHFATRMLDELRAVEVTTPHHCSGCNEMMEVRRRSGRNPALYWHCRPCQNREECERPGSRG